MCSDPPSAIFDVIFLLLCWFVVGLFSKKKASVRSLSNPLTADAIKSRAKKTQKKKHFNDENAIMAKTLFKSINKSHCID